MTPPTVTEILCKLGDSKLTTRCGKDRVEFQSTIAPLGEIAEPPDREIYENTHWELVATFVSSVQVLLWARTLPKQGKYTVRVIGTNRDDSLHKTFTVDARSFQDAAIYVDMQYTNVNCDLLEITAPDKKKAHVWIEFVDDIDEYSTEIIEDSHLEITKAGMKYRAD